MTTLPLLLNRKVNKRLISKEKYLKQQIIEYTKKLVLSSKLILDEDFDVLEDSLLIFLPHIIKNKTYLSLAASMTTFIILSKYNNFKLEKNLLLGLLPLSYELFYQGKYYWNKYNCFKTVDNFVKCLEHQATMNKKVLKHLSMRMTTLEELQSKINDRAFNMIRQNDIKFVQQTCEILTNICKTLQEQLVIQAKYSHSQYSYIGHWLFETCPENASYYDIATCVENLSQLYILLASNLMSSTVFALEVAFWQFEQDFNKVFNTIVDVVTLLKKTTKDLEAIFKDMSISLKKPIEVCRHTNKEDKKPSVYSESLDECKNHVRIIYDLAGSLEEQSPEMRRVFLEEMLENFEAGTVSVRNLLCYERSLTKVDNSTKNASGDVNMVKIDNSRRNFIITNDKEAEIGSDDEEFAYSPHESDDDFDGKHSKKQQSDFEEHENSKKSIAVQNLMLQELRNRMKDVRRIKISRTPAGDLIVQERPITLQESGGQTNNETNVDVSSKEVDTTLNCLPIGLPPPPPVPQNLQNLPKFRVSEEDIDNTSAIQPNVNKALIASISSIAKQRNQTEDIFGCDGDEYVPTDDSSDDELSY